MWSKFLNYFEIKSLIEVYIVICVFKLSIGILFYYFYLLYFYYINICNVISWVK